MAGPSFSSARDWLASRGADAVVVPHNDADGLSSGALLASRARGGVLHVESPWEGGALGSARSYVIADWGVRPVDAAVLYVDHHADPEPVDAPVVWESGGSTSLLAWRLLGEPPELAWLAALGAVGDLGDRAPAVPGSGSRAALRRLATLTSAPGRLRGGPVAAAYRVLAESAAPAEALRHPGVAELDRARVEVEAHRKAAIRTAPRTGRAAALIEIDAPARVHSQVAIAWARRLAPRVVVVANRGWRARTVSFAIRSAEKRDLRAWLRSVYMPPPGSGDYARGHARATGGSLVPDAYEQFARAVLEAEPAAPAAAVRRDAPGRLRATGRR